LFFAGLYLLYQKWNFSFSFITPFVAFSCLFVAGGISNFLNMAMPPQFYCSEKINLLVENFKL